MLTDKEKQGFREILQNLSEDDLVALKDTVTNRLIAARNKQEAIQAVIQYTDNALQLLRRKKLKRDLIFRYLANHGVAVSPNADKSKLIRSALTFWDTHVNQAALQNYDDDDDVLEVLALPAPARFDVQEHDDVQELLQIATPARVERNIQEVRELHRPPPAQQRQDHNYNNRPPQFVVHVAAAQPAAPPAVVTPVAQQLAKQYVTWFFQELNSLSPHAAQSGATSDWGPHHFFNNCKLRMNIQSDEARLEAFETADTVSERFRALVQTEGLLFNPNIEADGTKGVDDSHGLVLVFVCGTIHKDGMCLGVFEQRFGLARDPLSHNNYKIKFTDVNVRSESVNKTPKLDSMSNFPAITGNS